MTTGPLSFFTGLGTNLNPGLNTIPTPDQSSSSSSASPSWFAIAHCRTPLSRISPKKTPAEEAGVRTVVQV